MIKPIESDTVKKSFGKLYLINWGFHFFVKLGYSITFKWSRFISFV